MADDENV